MTKLICADSSCKFNGDNNVCEKQEVRLTYHGVNTVWDGFQAFHKCNEYEMNEKYAKFAEHFKGLVQRRENDA